MFFLLSFLPTKIIFFFSFEIRQVITVNGARVVKPDIEATNGVIHIVDRVLFPVPQADIYNTLKTDPQQRYTTLISAIDRAGLTAVLANPTGNFPFFLRSFSLFQQG
jgi:transforming growth factor-beta-induced protein